MTKTEIERKVRVYSGSRDVDAFRAYNRRPSSAPDRSIFNQARKCKSMNEKDAVVRSNVEVARANLLALESLCITRAHLFFKILI